MAIHKERRSDADATVIRRLADSGSVLLGKLVLTQGAYAEHCEPFVAPLNPWNNGYWSGASSSGSGVALASGLCFGCLGSDTGGSVRLPSSINGVTGNAAHLGRVSRAGVFELAATLDQIGPMARSAADVAAILSVIAAPTQPTRPHPASLCLTATSRSARAFAAYESGLILGTRSPGSTR